NVIEQLLNKPEPLVKQIPPAPGSRAERYVQLLAPDLHDIQAADAASASTASQSPGVGAAQTLGERIAKLEAENSLLRAAISKLAAEIGAADPLATSADPSTPGNAAP